MCECDKSGRPASWPEDEFIKGLTQDIVRVLGVPLGWHQALMRQLLQEALGSSINGRLQVFREKLKREWELLAKIQEGLDGQDTH
jgi:hypothetical protein